MRKLCLLVLTLILVGTTIPFAQASSSDEVFTYGFTDDRTREGLVNGSLIEQCFKHWGGKSFSQPLLLDGNRWGGEFAGETLMVSVEGNTLYGFKLEAPPVLSWEVPDLKPLFSVWLDGTQPTKSDPTYVERDGRKYLYIGTYGKMPGQTGAALDIVDITDFRHPNKHGRTTPHATDITSAPLVVDWNGHEIIVTGTGNAGKVALFTDLGTSLENTFYLNASNARISSSPAPLRDAYGNTIGFIIGVSKTPGEVQVYYFEDLFNETGGKLQWKSSKARVVTKTTAGVAGSFAVDGQTFYFGDLNSNLYALNAATGKFKWGNNAYAGIFANRSPALSDTTMYWAATGKEKQPGKVIAVDKSTGKVTAVRSFNSSYAQCPPTVIYTADGGMGILQGTSSLTSGGDAYLFIFHPQTLDDVGANVAGYSFAQKDWGGLGGAISAARDWIVASTEQGIVGWHLVDELNLQAVSIDSGVPEGEKAEAGQTYTGTVVYKYEAGTCPVASPPVQVTVNGKPVKLLDENGAELPKTNVAGSNQSFYYLMDLPLGEERTVYFRWTAAASGEIVGAVNLDRPPMLSMAT